MKQRAVAIACALACLLRGQATAEIKPDSNAPVFRIFASGAVKGGSSSPINIAGKPPLMVVSAVSKVQTSQDRKSVRIILTSSDTRKFADITRKHLHELLILEGGGRVLEAMQVTEPVTNGTLEFSGHNDSAVIDYLRKRFRLK